MKRLFLLFLFLGITFSTNAQSIFGKWQSFDEKTKKLESIIEVYKKDGKAYARIVSITDTERQDAVCTECKGKKKGKPILGMDILSGLKKKGDEWSGGKILDPKSGKEYKCYIKLIDQNLSLIHISEGPRSSVIAIKYAKGNWNNQKHIKFMMVGVFVSPDPLKD